MVQPAPEDTMETRNFQSALESALIDAGKAHHALVEDMKKTLQSVDAIQRENENWPVFYAWYLEHKLRGVFSISRWPIPNLVSPETEHMPVAHIHPTHVWDGGPSWITASIEDKPVTESSRLHVG
jgi:hypothetical protein